MRVRKVWEIRAKLRKLEALMMSMTLLIAEMELSIAQHAPGNPEYLKGLADFKERRDELACQIFKHNKACGKAERLLGV